MGERLTPVLLALVGIGFWYGGLQVLDERIWPWAVMTLIGCICAWCGIQLEEQRRERHHNE